MRIKNTFIVISIISVLAACGLRDDSPPESVSGAVISTPYKVPKNSRDNTVEQQNIQDRIRVTTDTTKVLWIHLIGLDGEIIRRMPVRNKVTSSGKRLEPQHIVVDPNASDGSYPKYNGYYFDELLQADGTYGSSDPYIYWFDPQGRYHQWGTAGGLGYLVTDYPIDLENPIDQVTGMYRAHAAATAWQEEQEDALRGQPRNAEGSAR